MKREEAIRIIETVFQDEYVYKYYDSITHQALEVAIEALSEPSGDLISRDDAIEAIQNAYCKPCKERGDDHNEVRCRACEYDNAIIQIDALPSADTDISEYCDRLWKIAYERGKAESEARTKCVAQIKVDTEEVARRIKEEYDITYDWIPCSERLPKEKQEVYVTVYFIEGDTGRAYGYMDGFGTWHLYSAVEGTLNSGYEVIAWMPLPKPYREDGEVKE